MCTANTSRKERPRRFARFNYPAAERTTRSRRAQNIDGRDARRSPDDGRLWSRGAAATSLTRGRHRRRPGNKRSPTDPAGSTPMAGPTSHPRRLRRTFEAHTGAVHRQHRSPYVLAGSHASPRRRQDLPGQQCSLSACIQPRRPPAHPPLRVRRLLEAKGLHLHHYPLERGFLDFGVDAARFKSRASLATRAPAGSGLAGFSRGSCLPRRSCSVLPRPLKSSPAAAAASAPNRRAARAAPR